MAFGSWSNNTFKKLLTIQGNSSGTLSIEYQYATDPVANKYRWRIVYAKYTIDKAQNGSMEIHYGVGTSAGQYCSVPFTLTTDKGLMYSTGHITDFIETSTNQAQIYYKFRLITTSPNPREIILTHSWQTNVQTINSATTVTSNGTAYMTCPAIDRSAGTGTITYKSKTGTSITFDYSANVATDNIQYKIGSDGTYTTLYSGSTAANTVRSKTITGLNYGTSYTIYARHRRTFNQVFSGGYSFTVTTLAYPFTVYFNDGGTWRKAKAIYYNDGGTWRKAKAIYYNDGGTWRKSKES